MNEIEKLIQELCPDGVEYRRLGECLDYEQPGKYIVTSKDYIESGIPVLTAGQTFILGYTDEINGIYQANKENPVIIFDDFTTSFHWVTFDFKVKSSAMKMLKPKTNNVVFRYVYHVMKCIKYETLEHSRQWISKYSNIEIPLPPITIQEKIVEILDKFTSLEAELEAELEARRKQYEYYREKLLTFSPEEVEYRRLGEVADCYSGATPKTSIAAYWENGTIPWMNSGEVNLGRVYKTENKITKAGYDSCSTKMVPPHTVVVALAGQGKTRGTVAITEIELCTNQSLCAIKVQNEIVNSYYLYHYLRGQYLTLRKISSGDGTRGGLNQNMIRNFEIPLPPLSEQRRIVEILDRFEALTNDLQAGLPAEIEARRQQYEYYREKLLTFKRKTV